MKALSVREPWARCFFEPLYELYDGGGYGDRLKDVENRSWRTRYRGPVPHAWKVELIYHYELPRAFGFWVVCKPRWLVRPAPWKGLQGLFEVPDEVLVGVLAG